MNEQVQSEIFSAIGQVVVVFLIAFICFLFRRDKSIFFYKYLGLYKPTTKSIAYATGVSILFAIATIGFNFISADLKQATLAPDSVIGKLRQMGFSSTSLIILLITALFKTSFAEEVLFRGLIAKRLVNKFGYKTGNLIQAFIFGILHVLLFWLLIKATLIPLIIIFILISFFAWMIVYVQEKLANGSILPSWIIHGLANTICYYIVAYVIF